MNDWISVNDRLPETGGNGWSKTVLVVVHDERGAYRALDRCYGNGHWAEYRGVVSHWMPLPPFPEGVDRRKEPSQ